MVERAAAMPGDAPGQISAHAQAPSGILQDGLHVYPLRVFYEDTDAAGIVYYANYLKFIERARTEMMRIAGISHSGALNDAGAMFIVRRCTVDYRLPARLDDCLTVHTRMLRLRGVTIDVEQIVKRDDAVLVNAELKLACIDRSGKPVRLPAALRQVLGDMMTSVT